MSELDDLVCQIKNCWPKFVITKEALSQPTQELVVQFYSNVIEDHKKKVALLTGSSITFDYNFMDYEPEEQLFLQISRLLGKISNLKFTLGDIYQPTPIRTKNFFKVCIHFVAFTDGLQHEAEILGNEVLKTKEDTEKLSLERQELIEEINENAKSKAELSEKNNLLDQELKSTRASYKEMNSLKASKEKLYAEKRNQIENLNRDLQNEEYELKRLENIQKDLLEQRITERDHQNIVNTIEALKSESEMLDNDDINIDDGLVHENKVLQHSADCIRMLNKCEFNVENVKQLVHKEEELKVILNTVDQLTATKLNPARQQKLETEQKLVALKEKVLNLQSQFKIVENNYTSNITQFSEEFNKVKIHIQNESSNNTNIILNYKQDIEKLEQDMDRMRKAFTTEYVRVSKVEKVVIDKFKEMLMKFKEMELL